VRFENLFDDLSSQLEHELRLDERELRVEEERLRLGRLGLRDRLRAVADASAGTERAMRIGLIDGTTLRLRPTAFGRDWMSGELAAEGAAGRAAASTRVIVPLDAIASVALSVDQIAVSLDVEDAADRSATPRLIDRLGLAFALRDLARRRGEVDLVLRSGPLHGTIDRVARDHLDLAVHDADAPRRAANVRDVRLIPLAAVLLIRG
jgi:hypothetical protein